MTDFQIPEPVYRYTPEEQKKNWEKFVADGWARLGKPTCLCGCWMPIEWEDLEGGTFYLSGHEPLSQRPLKTSKPHIPEVEPVFPPIVTWSLFILAVVLFYLVISGF